MNYTSSPKKYKERINKCPFCGNKNLNEHTDDYIMLDCGNVLDYEDGPNKFRWWVRCWRCRSVGPRNRTADGAIESWNKPTAKFKERKPIKRGLIGKIL